MIFMQQGMDDDNTATGEPSAVQCNKYWIKTVIREMGCKRKIEVIMVKRPEGIKDFKWREKKTTRL